MASATMKRGGRVQKLAAGGTTETNQYGSWGGANAANAVTGTAAPTSNYNSTTLSTPGSGGPFNTNPSGGGYIPGAYRAAGDVIGGTNPTTGAWNNTGLYSATGTPVNTSSDQYLSGANFSSQPNTPAPMWPIGGGQYSPTPGNGGKGYTWRKGGSIPVPKEEPYRNKWKAKNHPGDSSYKFDNGGDVPDPGGVDMGQGQEGQAGDLSSALAQVQQAYQYGLQQVAGNIPTVPAGPGGDQTQGGGPQDRGQQMAAARPASYTASTGWRTATRRAAAYAETV